LVANDEHPTTGEAKTGDGEVGHLDDRVGSLALLAGADLVEDDRDSDAAVVRCDDGGDDARLGKVIGCTRSVLVAFSISPTASAAQSPPTVDLLPVVKQTVASPVVKIGGSSAREDNVE
jgi:hypothetical protein